MNNIYIFAMLAFILSGVSYFAYWVVTLITDGKYEKFYFKKKTKSSPRHFVDDKYAYASCNGFSEYIYKKDTGWIDITEKEYEKGKNNEHNT